MREREREREREEEDWRPPMMALRGALLPLMVMELRVLALS